MKKRRKKDGRLLWKFFGPGPVVNLWRKAKSTIESKSVRPWEIKSLRCLPDTGLFVLDTLYVRLTYFLQCVLHASYVHLTYVLQASYMRLMCILYASLSNLRVSYVCLTCVFVWITCILTAFYKRLTCVLHASYSRLCLIYMHLTCVLHASFMRRFRWSEGR